MSTIEKLREDTCTFPSETLALHDVAAEELKLLYSRIAELEHDNEVLNRQALRQLDVICGAMNSMSATEESYHILHRLTHTDLE